jgi:alanine racemase
MRTWAEISLLNLEHNYRALRGMLSPDCRFLGVVKANAYGHGAVPVAKKLQELGAEYLAVACLQEAKELREAGITLPILLLGYTSPELTEELLTYHVTQTVFDIESAKQMSDVAVKLGTKLTVHIKSDTGMSRLGFWGDGARESIAAVCRLPGLYAEGIFTHFSDADDNEEFTMQQFTTFLDLISNLEKTDDIHFEIRHCAASAAMLKYPCTHLDMVRPGIALYGHYPSPETEGLDGPGLRPVMTVKSRLVSLKTLPTGTPISYGRTHILNRETTVAAIPIGYGDGFYRLLSNRTRVLLHGETVPVLGRICMDMCMLDVTDLSEVSVGDEVVVFGEELPLEEKTDLLGTITYELLCAVASRVPRIYLTA